MSASAQADSAFLEEIKRKFNDNGVSAYELCGVMLFLSLLIACGVAFAWAIGSSYQLWRIDKLPVVTFSPGSKWMIEPNWMQYRAKIYSNESIVLCYPAYGDYFRIVSHSAAIAWIRAKNDVVDCHVDRSQQDSDGFFGATEQYYTIEYILIFVVVIVVLLSFIISAAMMACIRSMAHATDQLVPR